MNANSSEPARSNKAAVLLNELQKELELEARRLETERARLDAEAALINSRVTARASDIITLNVGGTILSTTRRTLTLAPESFLASMFNGRWEDSMARDEAGRVFLDYNPALFTLILNWLRAQDMAGALGSAACASSTGAGPAPHGADPQSQELTVPQQEEHQLLVLIDFLQLQRYVPVRYRECFSPILSSPHITLANTSAWRPLGAGRAGYLVIASAARTHFDVCVELVVEVLRFGASRRKKPAPATKPGQAPAEQPDEPPNSAMFIGIVAAQELQGVDQSKSRANVTFRPSAYGWWTSQGRESKVEAGVSTTNGSNLMWTEGDTLALTLDCRKSHAEQVTHGPVASTAAAGAAKVTKGSGAPKSTAAGAAAPSSSSATAAAGTSQVQRPTTLATANSGSSSRTSSASAAAGNGLSNSAADTATSTATGALPSDTGTSSTASALGAGSGVGTGNQLLPLPGLTLTLVNHRTRGVWRLSVDDSMLVSALRGAEERWAVVVGLGGYTDEVRINTARQKGLWE